MGSEMCIRDRIKAVWADVDRVIDYSIGVEKSTALADLAFELRNALGGHEPAANQT